MTEKLLRIKTVMDMTGKSRSAIYADISSGCFPKSIAIGARSVAWAESAISIWIKSKIDAASPKPKSRVSLLWNEVDREAVALAKARRLMDEEI